MNLAYLGDAPDHWKGSLFEFLQSEGIVRHFAVDTMATDRNQWNEADFCLYARFLRINRDQIVQHEASIANRKGYFSEIQPSRHADVFLDPDIGILTGAPTAGNSIDQYVKPRELADILGPGRLVVVYQHVRGAVTCDRVDSCAATIRKTIASVQWCSYESSTVAMLFLSVEEARTREIAQAFEQLLGRHAERRIRSDPKSLS